MNINSNATSAIVDRLFRLVRDGSALCGPFGARHRGCCGSDWKADSFMILDRSRGALGVLCADDLRALMHFEQVCCVWRCRAGEKET